jgi:hypothetical protein
MRRILLGTGIAIGLLLVAGAVAFYVATRERPLMGATSGNDFAWLTDAMQQCDKRATSEPNRLHILVTPLTAPPNTFDEWKAKSLNDMGNAIVLGTDATVSALRGGTLTVMGEPYVFSIRDEATKTVYRWEPSSGVKWFSTAEGAGIQSFSMQIKPRSAGRDDAWGNPIARQAGNCYWVNALISP